MNKILYEKETLFLEIISRGYGNRDLYNLFNFWNKVRENLSKFSINKNLVNTIKEIEKQVANLELNIKLKEEEKQKNNSVKLNKNSNNHVHTKKIIRNQNELNKSEKQHMLKENVKIKKDDLNKKENNSFIFCEEILDKNIFQISKNGQNIISFIDIDLLLQRIAQGKNIYDDITMENNLLNGFCVQHTAFIKTDVLISKIISCYNYFYSRYKQQISKKNEELDINIFRKDNIKMPYNIIQLLIIFIDLNNKYCREIFTLQIVEEIHSFYNNIIKINEIKKNYEQSILDSIDILKEIYNTSILKRTNSLHNKIPYEKLFPKQITLMDIIASPNNPVSYFNIIDLDSKEIAKELTYISYKLYSKIEIQEFLKGVFTKKNKSITSPNITNITNRFNKLSFWTIEEILMYDYPYDRGRAIEKFIDIIKELVILNNFYDSLSISSALSQIIISNLHKTWSYVSKQSMELYQKYKTFLSFNDNYKNIRDKISDCAFKNEPYIPFLGPYSKTICYMEEYGPYIKDNSLVNVDKIVLVQQVFEQLFRYKVNKYNKFEITKNELYILYCLDPASEEELEKLASLIEPKYVLFDQQRKEKRASNTEKNFKKNYENNDDLI